VEKNLQKLFKQASYTPESRLSGDIWKVIEYKKNHISKINLLKYMILGVLSLSGSIFSIKILIEQLSKLGFFDYLSLVFSDSGIIVTYWKEYIMTLAESLPIFSLNLSFFLLFILFISIRKMSYQFKQKLLLA